MIGPARKAVSGLVGCGKCFPGFWIPNQRGDTGFVVQHDLPDRKRQLGLPGLQALPVIAHPDHRVGDFIRSSRERARRDRHRNGCRINPRQLPSNLVR